MPVTKKLPPLPRPDVPMIDIRTGQITPDWFRFFTELMALIQEIRGLTP